MVHPHTSLQELDELSSLLQVRIFFSIFFTLYIILKVPLAAGTVNRGSDIISAGSALSGSYTMTLGSENLSNANGNVCLIRIALTSGQSITSLNIT